MIGTCVLASKAIGGNLFIIGVFSSAKTAFELFLEKLKHHPYPYSGGVLKYLDWEMLNYALPLNTNAHSILIWTNNINEVYIIWNIVDKPIP